MATISKIVKSAVRPPNAGKGRKKGVPNKFTGALKEMILEALKQAGGVEYLTKRADDNPAAFLTLVGKVLPLQLTGEGGGAVKVERIERVLIQPNVMPNEDRPSIN